MDQKQHISRFAGRRIQPRPVESKIPSIPTLPEIPSVGEIRTVPTGGPREGPVMPLSVTDRVTLVRNNMHGNFLQKSNQKLQNEIDHTMKMYSVEKHQLLKQLATLRHNMADLRLSEDSHTDRRKFSKFYDNSAISYHEKESNRLPPLVKTNYVHNEFYSRGITEHHPKDLFNDVKNKDIFEQDYAISSSDENSDQDEDDTETTPEKVHTRNRREGPALKLPQIKEEPLRPHWYSGNNSHQIKPKVSNLLSSLPQIKEMKAVAENSYNIPQSKDPLRSEISLPTKQKAKKVHFVNTESPTMKVTLRDNHLPPVSVSDKLQKVKPRSRRRKDNSGDIPAVADNSQTMQEWKSMYVNIHDPEQRTKTLGDILYAVRVRMRENEHHLMYGQKHEEDKTDSNLCDYLLTHTDNHDAIRRTKKTILPHHKRYHIPNHTAERVHRKSNAVRLQSYLKKLSRQRRMIEHLQGEEYRLTYIVRHSHLWEAAKKSVH